MSRRKLYDFHGERLTLEELAAHAGISKGSIRSRLARRIALSDPALVAPQQRATYDVKIGDRFGLFTVESEMPRHMNRRTFACRCICGRTRALRVPELVKSQIVSCGCRDKRIVRGEDWIGRVVGRLTVVGIERGPRTSTRTPGAATLLCRCACGSETRRGSSSLSKASKEGLESMCGDCRSHLLASRNGERSKKDKVRRNLAAPGGPGPVLRAKRENNGSRRKVLVDRRFGRLVVKKLDPTKANTGRMQRWRCGCDCGRECSVLQCHLVTGKTRSCGCIRRCHDLFGTKLTIGELAGLAGASHKMVTNWLRAGTPPEECLRRAAASPRAAARPRTMHEVSRGGTQSLHV